MNLYLLSQDINDDYDTYDAAIVAAPDEESAKKIHPDGSENALKPNTMWNTWCPSEYVKVKYIGKADKTIKKGVILASFKSE